MAVKNCRWPSSGERFKRFLDSQVLTKIIVLSINPFQWSDHLISSFLSLKMAEQSEASSHNITSLYFGREALLHSYFSKNKRKCNWSLYPQKFTVIAAIWNLHRRFRLNLPRVLCRVRNRHGWDRLAEYQFRWRSPTFKRKRKIRKGEKLRWRRKKMFWRNETGLEKRVFQKMPEIGKLEKENERTYWKCEKNDADLY